MKAAVLHAANQPLQIEDVPLPTLTPNHLLLRVLACGVCRTDLHIYEGDLPLIHQPLILGHQIVGEVIEGATTELPAGTRVGVSWIGGTDGTCPFCLRDEENLCDNPTFTGYTVNGGYAEYALVRADFIFPLPDTLDNTHVAPLLCAGIIGFRSLRVAGTQPGERVGLFGFGASASKPSKSSATGTAKSTSPPAAKPTASKPTHLGANWVGTENDKPPVQLDRAITFAPSGAVVLSALSSLRKGGIVAINAIHLDQMPAFDYDTLLWGERQIRSVANMTRQRRPRLPPTRRRNRHQAPSPDLPPRPGQRSPPSRKKRNRQRPLRHPPLASNTKRVISTGAMDSLIVQSRSANRRPRRIPVCPLSSRRTDAQLPHHIMEPS